MAHAHMMTRMTRWLAGSQFVKTRRIHLSTIDPNYQKLFSQSLIVEISRKRAPLESDREHFWGIHFYNFPLFSSLLQVDLLPSGASLVWPRPLNSWSALDLCTFAYQSKKRRTLSHCLSDKRNNIHRNLEIACTKLSCKKYIYRDLYWKNTPCSRKRPPPVSDH